MRGDFAIVNRIDDSEVFVYCMSTEHSAELYQQFEAEACIEITSPAQFLKDCRAAARRRMHRNWRLEAGPVAYYAVDRPAPLDLTSPRHLCFQKLETFASQREFRLALLPEDLKPTKILQPGRVLDEPEESVVPRGQKELFLTIPKRPSYLKVHIMPSG